MGRYGTPWNMNTHGIKFPCIFCTFSFGDICHGIASLGRFVLMVSLWNRRSPRWSKSKFGLLSLRCSLQSLARVNFARYVQICAQNFSGRFGLQVTVDFRKLFGDLNARRPWEFGPHGDGRITLDMECTPWGQHPMVNQFTMMLLHGKQPSTWGRIIGRGIQPVSHGKMRFPMEKASRNPL